MTTKRSAYLNHDSHTAWLRRQRLAPRPWAAYFYDLCYHCPSVTYKSNCMVVPDDTPMPPSVRRRLAAARRRSRAHYRAEVRCLQFNHGVRQQLQRPALNPQSERKS